MGLLVVMRAPLPVYELQNVLKLKQDALYKTALHLAELFPTVDVRDR